MASITQPAEGKLLDYEEYIDHQLRRTRNRIKMTDVFTSILILAALGLGALFLEVVLDHRVGLPYTVRLVVLLTGLVAAGVYAGRKIVRPLLLTVNSLYAAKTIETADPSFKNTLISYLDLLSKKEHVPKSFLRAVESRAVTELTKVDVDAVVNQNRLMKTLYALAGIAVLFALYAIITPKSILDSTRRALLADVSRPTDTTLDNLLPGHSKVVAGANIPFSVETKGARPQNVILHYSVDGGDFFAQQELAPGKADFEPWRTTLRNAQRDLLYFVTAGDAESTRYSIEVLPAPMVTGVSIDYEFPKYTKVPERLNVEGGNVHAIEGTLVKVKAQTNQPASSGMLDLGKIGQYPINPSENDPTKLLGQFRLTTDGSYTIKFTTTSGQKNPDPVVYDIRVEKDKPPTARFLRPNPAIKVASNAKVALVMEAADDFGVLDATLHVNLGNEILISDNLLQDRPPTPKLVESYDLDLTKFKLRPGDKLTYWLTARDVKDPLPNRVETNKYEIEVIEPLNRQELARHEEKEQQEKQNQEQAAKTEQENKDQNQPQDQNPPQGEPKQNGQGNANQADNPGQPNGGEQGKAGEQPPAQNRPEQNDPRDEGKPNPNAAGNPEQGKSNGNQDNLSPEDRQKLDRIQRELDRLKSNQNPNQDQRQAKAEPNPQRGAEQPNNPATNPPKDDVSRNNGNRQPNEQPKPNEMNRNAQNSPRDQTGGRDEVSKPSPNQDQGNGSKPEPNSPMPPKADQSNQGKSGENSENAGKPDGSQNRNQSKPEQGNEGGQPGADQQKPGNQDPQGRPGENSTSKGTGDQAKGTRQPSAPQAGDQGKNGTQSPRNQNQAGQKPEMNPERGAEQGTPGQDQNRNPGNNASADPKGSRPERGQPGNQQGKPEQGKDGMPPQGKPEQGQPGNQQGKPEQGKDGMPPQGKPEQGQPGNQPGKHEQGQPGAGQGKPEQGQPGNQQGKPEQGKDGMPPQGKPEQGQPGAGQDKPEQGQPGNQQGKPEQGENGMPPQGKPEQGQPGAGQGKPEQGQPGNQQGKPEQRQPGAGQGKPEQGQPGAGQGKPEQGQPGNQQGKPEQGTDGMSPQGGKPEQGQPGAGQGKPEQGRPGTSQGKPEQGNSGADPKAKDASSSAGGDKPETAPGRNGDPTAKGRQGEGNAEGKGNESGEAGKGMKGGQPGGEQSQKGGQQGGEQGQKGGQPGGQQGEKGGQQGGQQGQKGGQPGGQQGEKGGQQGGEQGQKGGQPGGEQGQKGGEQGQKGGQPGQGQPMPGGQGGKPMPGGETGGQPGNEPGPVPQTRSDGTFGTPTKDESKPLPDVTGEAPDRAGPSPAPDIQQAVPQSDVVRRLDQLLKNDQVTPEMEKNLGMSKAEMQQFVKRFEKKEQPKSTRAPRVIQAKPGEERKVDPNRAAPDFQPGVTVSNRNSRGSSNLNDDNNAGLAEGALSNAPPELRKRFEAYKSSLGRTGTGSKR